MRIDSTGSCEANDGLHLLDRFAIAYGRMRPNAREFSGHDVPSG
jgi:hypothetical protein